MKNFQAKNHNKLTITISPIEWVILTAFVLLGCFVGYRFATGPAYWDDLLYLHTAWNHEVDTSILNRYFTIYLLQFFNMIAGGDPLLGGRYFGSFVFSAIVALTYLNARILAKAHHILIGMLSVLFLLPFSSFASEFGIVLADYTVTMMVLLGVLIYLLFLRSLYPSKALLIFFGMIVFLSFKSKENGLFLCVLIPGLLANLGEDLSWKTMANRVGLILVGVFLGFVLVLILDGVILGDPFLGWRSANVEGNINFYLRPQTIIARTKSANYFGYIAPMGMFLLSLVWILKSDDNHRSSNKWLWGMALCLIAFLELMFVYYEFLTVRYLTPAGAVLSILAPQVLAIEDQSFSPRQAVRYLAFGLGSVLLSGLIVLAFFFFLVRPLGWAFDAFSVAIISPLALCVLLFWLSFRKKDDVFSLVIVVACIGAMTLPSATRQVYEVLTGQMQEKTRFIPFAEFTDEVACGKGKIFISGTIYRQHKMLSRDVASSQWMYNLFFHCHSNLEQFAYSKTQRAMHRMLSSEKYQYVFLDASDYLYLLAMDQDKNTIQNYSLISDGHERFYLLVDETLR